MEEGDSVLQRRLEIQRREEALKVPNTKRETWGTDTFSSLGNFSSNTSIRPNFSNTINTINTITPTPNNTTTTSQSTPSVGQNPENLLGDIKENFVDLSNPINNITLEDGEIPLVVRKEGNLVIRMDDSETEQEDIHEAIVDPSDCKGTKCENGNCDNPFCIMSQQPNFYNLPEFLKNARNTLLTKIDVVDRSVGFEEFDIAEAQKKLFEVNKEIVNMYSQLKALKFYKEVNFSVKKNKQKRKCPFTTSEPRVPHEDIQDHTGSELPGSDDDIHNPEENELRKTYPVYQEFQNKRIQELSSRVSDIKVDMNNNNTPKRLDQQIIESPYFKSSSQVKKMCMSCSVYKTIPEMKMAVCNHAVCNDCFTMIFASFDYFDCLTCGLKILTQALN